jgi:hypothetical protein
LGRVKKEMIDDGVLEVTRESDGSEICRLIGPEAPTAGPEAPTAGPEAPTAGPEAPSADDRAEWFRLLHSEGLIIDGQIDGQ